MDQDKKDFLLSHFDQKEILSQCELINLDANNQEIANGKKAMILAVDNLMKHGHDWTAIMSVVNAGVKDMHNNEDKDGDTIVTGVNYALTKYSSQVKKMLVFDWGIQSSNSCCK